MNETSRITNRTANEIEARAQVGIDALDRLTRAVLYDSRRKVAVARQVLIEILELTKAKTAGKETA